MMENVQYMYQYNNTL